MSDGWYIGSVSCVISAGDAISVYRPDRDGHITITAAWLDETIYLTRDSVLDLMRLLHIAMTSEDRKHSD